MSQWTHVAAVFRLDSLGPISDENIIECFGKPVTYKELGDYDESDPSKVLPMGSEGSLEMSIWHNPDHSELASTTVSVFGDLRDFGGNEGLEKLKKWFDDCCKNFMVRQAVMHIEDEYADEPVVVQYCYGK